MGQSYFIWNGIDCRSRGIIQSSPAPIIRPEERVNHVQIPGRSGDLTETEGENIFNSYIQTVTISVRGGMYVRQIYNWLKGSGYVTFSGEPDRRQPARIIGAITLNKHSKNLDIWTGEIQFYCQPLKELLFPNKESPAYGATMRNNGDVVAKPLFKITTNSTSASVGFTWAGIPFTNSLTLSGLTSGVVYWIDSETMEVLNADKSATVTEKSEGAFPVLRAGTNIVSFTGISTIEIDKRERFL